MDGQQRKSLQFKILSKDFTVAEILELRGKEFENIENIAEAISTIDSKLGAKCNRNIFMNGDWEPKV